MSRWNRIIACAASFTLAVSLMPAAGLAFAAESVQDSAEPAAEQPVGAVAEQPAEQQTEVSADQAAEAPAGQAPDQATDQEGQPDAPVTEGQIEQTVDPTRSGGQPAESGAEESEAGKVETDAGISLNEMSPFALGGLRSINALELSAENAAAAQSTSDNTYPDAIPISSLLMMRAGEVTLENGKTYNLDTDISASAGRPAIALASGATVTIVVGGNRTLRGGAGTTTLAACPAIEVPASSTLILTTEGVKTASLSCIGGNAGAPQNGGDAEHPANRDESVSVAGSGGRGGSGAAPGIGGRSGVGGAGTQGKSRADGDAKKGDDGSAGTSGTSCGTLHLLGKLTVNASAGSITNPGVGGAGGNGAGSGRRTQCGHGGGGAGGAGGGAYGVGGGGAGGGGGASGGVAHYRDAGAGFDANVGGSGGGGAGGSATSPDTVQSGGVGGAGTEGRGRGSTGANSVAGAGGIGGNAASGDKGDGNGGNGGNGGPMGTPGGSGNIYLSRDAKLNTSGSLASYGNGSSSTIRQNTHTEMRFCTLELEYTTTPYTGTQRTPSVTVKYGNTVVPSDQYTVSYEDATDVGTATVTVTGKGTVTQANSFGGSNSAEFEITKIDDPFTATTSRSTFEYGEQCTLGVSDINSYNTTGVTWSVVSGPGSLSTTTGTSPTLTPTAQGVVTVRATIPASRNFNEATADVAITVKPRNITYETNGVLVANTPTQTYTAKKITPQPAVTFPTNKNTAATTLISGTDFTYSYPQENLNTPGGGDHNHPASITVTGKGNYTGSRTVTFAIGPRSIQSGSGVVISQPANATFTGNAIKRSVTLQYGGVTLSTNDYNLSYTTDLTNVGTKTITITGKNNLSGTVTKTYSINKASIANAAVKTNPIDVFFDDKAIESRPALTFTNINLTEQGKGGTAANPDDYTLTFANNKEQGTATVTITGINNFNGTKSLTYKIKPRPLYVRPLADQWKYYGTDDFYPQPDDPNGGTEPKYETLVKKLSADSASELDEYVPGASCAGTCAPQFTGALSREAGVDTGFYGFLKNDLAIPASASARNHNYALQFLLDKTLYPTYQIKDYEAEEPATLEGTMGKNDWYVGTPVHIVAPDGFTISKSNSTGADNTWSSFITYEDGDYSTEDKARTYYLKNDTTNAITTQCTITYKQDTHNPTGNIAVGEDAWSSLPEHPDYEVFFNDDVNAGVFADDVTSDVAFIHYFLGEDGQVYDKSALAAKPLEEWESGASVELPIEDLNQTKRVLYARVEDFAGNVEYISTDGIIFDKVIPHLEAEYPYDNEWTTEENPQITGVVYDNDSGLKDRFAAYRAGDDPLQVLELGGGSNFSVGDLKDGDYATTIEAWDRAENKAVPVTFMIKKDTVQPKLTVSGDTANIAAMQDVSFAPAVGASGVAKLEVRYEDEPWTEVESGVQAPYTVHKNGEYFFRITNGAGVVSEETSIIFTKIDTAAPEVKFALANEAGETLEQGAWSNSNVDIAFSNQVANLGTSTFEYWDEAASAWVELSAPAPEYTAHVPLLTDEGEHTVRVRITSQAGISTEASANVKIDKSAPGAQVSVERYEGNPVLQFLTAQQFFKAAVKATAAPYDKPDVDASGVASIEYFALQAPEGEQLTQRPANAQELEKAAEGAWQQGEVCMLEGDAAYAVYFRMTDNAGNVGYATTDDVIIDSQGPAISFDYEREGAWDAAPSVGVRVDDQPYGVASTTYEIDDNGSTSPADPASFDVTGFDDGTHTLTVTSQDNSGNESSRAIEVKKDSGTPSLTATLVQESVTDEEAQVEVAASYEGPSGLANVRYSIDGGAWVDITDAVTADGSVTVKENGTYTFRAETGAGATSDVTLVVDSFVAKTLEPQLEAFTADGEACESGVVTNQDVKLVFTNKLLGLKGVEYWYREAGAPDWSAIVPVHGRCEVVLDTEGQHAYEFSMSFADAPDRTEPLTFEASIDKTNPTGSITLGQNSWTSALAALTNGLLFQDSQLIEFAGKDEAGAFNSGVETVEYAVIAAEDAAGADSAAAVDELVGEGWETGTATQVDPSGSYVAFARVTDHAGNRCYLKSDGVTVDNVTPVLESDVREDSWYTDDADMLHFTVSDDVSGVDSVRYSLDGATSQDATLDAQGSFAIGLDQLANGQNVLELSVQDVVGNEYNAGYTVLKDVVLPAVAPADISGNPDDVVAVRDIQVNATAGVSGVKTVEVKTPNSVTWIDIAADEHYLDAGCYAAKEDGTYWFRASNGAGRYGDPQAVTVGNIDSTQPQIAHEVFLADGGTYNQPDWTTETVFVKFRNTVRNMDNCTYWYQVDDGARQALTPDEAGDVQFEVTQEGAHDYLIGITSQFGADSDPLIVQVRRDTTAPAVNVVQSATPWQQGNTTLDVQATDDGSGLHDLAYSYDAGATWTSEPVYIMGTNRDVVVGVRDALGNTTFEDMDVLALDNWAPTVFQAEVDQADIPAEAKDVSVVLDDFADASGRPGSGVAKAFVSVDYPYENNVLVREPNANAVMLERSGGSNEWDTQEPVAAKWDGDNEAWIVAIDRVGNARVYGLTMPNMVGTSDEPRHETPVDPNDPDNPLDPDNPNDPDDPDNPNGSDKPVDPNNPVDPDNPNVPVDPNNPNDPSNSGNANGSQGGAGGGSGSEGGGGPSGEGSDGRHVRPLPSVNPANPTTPVTSWQTQLSGQDGAHVADYLLSNAEKDDKKKDAGKAKTDVSTKQIAGNNGASFSEEELRAELTAAATQMGVQTYVWWFPVLVALGLGAAIAVVASSKGKKRKGAGNESEN